MISFPMCRLVLLAFFSGWILSPLFLYFTNLSLEAHNFCLQSSPPSHWKSFYQAIVCGKKLQASQQWQQMRQLGMLHILIVSGAHLSFLSQTLRFLFFHHLPENLKNLILLGLVVVCQFQAPALRAWCYLFINGINKKKRLFLKPPALLLLTIIFCLSVNPPFFQSMSLPLTWLACLGIGLGKNSFTQSFFCFLFLQPIISQWGSPSPLTIGVNAFITPLVGMILFPASLFCFFLPFLTPLVDKLWNFLFYLAKTLSPSLTLSESQNLSEGKLWIWLYALVLNISFMGWEFYKDNKAIQISERSSCKTSELKDFNKDFNNELF